MSRSPVPFRLKRPVAARLAAAAAVLGTLVVGATTVFADPPTASFTVNPDPAVTGQEATFQADASDSDGIATYEWDFDGGGYEPASASPTATHTFGTPGTKNVKLKVTDAAAVPEAVEVTQAVTVNDPPPTPPSNVLPPSVGGTPVDGGTLTANDGMWNGTEPITFTRKWQRCQGATCSDIDGATGTTYSPVPGDVGQTIRIVVTADNDAPGTVTEVSAATAPVAAKAPVNTAAPDVDGAAVEGETLSLSNGNGGWSGTPPITFVRQWQRCSPACADIPGATGFGYILKAADLGSTIRVRVTADNPAPGTTPAFSAAIGPIQAPPPGPPANMEAPTIAGAAIEGSTLFVGSHGLWDGTRPFNPYTYQWQRCKPACANIDGATANSYALVPADVGATIRVQVTASNGVGAATAPSDPTAAVARRPPSNLALPSISGPGSVGQTLTESDGLWTGTEPITYTRRWLRCNAAGAACAAVTGQTSTTYPVTQADLGKRIRVEVTADNASVGTVTATSTPTAAIVQNLPPVARFTASPASPLVGDPVVLTAAAFDPDGPLASLQWDLDGDGQYTDDNATDRVASTTFTTVGQHTVGLRVTDTDGVTDVETAVIAVSARPVPPAPVLRLMSPFPIVRIIGTPTRRGARIKAVRVQARKGATVTVSCSGRDCPKSKKSSAKSKGRRIRFRRLERHLRSGTKIAVRVTYEGRIGKYTLFVIRRLRGPTRKDLCLMPDKRKPVRCPSE